MNGLSCTPEQLVAGWSAIGILAILGAYLVYMIWNGKKELADTIESYQKMGEDAKKFYEDAVQPHIDAYDASRKDYLDIMKRIQSDQIPDPNVEVVDYYPKRK